MRNSQTASKLRLYWRLQLAAHFMQKRADRDLIKRAGVTTAQTGVMAAIVNGENVTQKEVARTLGLNESAVTAMVRKLQAMGYVKRRKSETDGRAYLLMLTKAGRDAHKDVRPPFDTINEQIESVLDDNEIEQLADYLERLTRSFE